MQFFGSAGNLWSYRVEGPNHLEGYSVVPSAGGKVRREVPFVDYAGKILAAQKAKTDEKFKVLCQMRDQVLSLQDLLTKNFSVADFGHMLHQGWELKRSLTNQISSSQIDVWYNLARQAGAYGGKLCGAGGGGFLLFIAPPERHNPIRKALHELQEEEINFEPHGVRSIVEVHL